MSRLIWGQTGHKRFFTGVEKVALFVQNSTGYDAGVAWDGVTAVNETPAGGEATKIYADDTHYLTMYSLETLGGTIEAYQYPEEFKACNGEKELTTGVVIGQQTRKGFGLAFESLIGNDTESIDHGKELHLLYGCKASPTEIGHSTVNESPEASTMSWSFTTDPTSAGEGNKPTSRVVIDSTKVSDDAWTAIENAVYGSENTESALPTPEQVVATINAATNTTPGDKTTPGGNTEG